jgi:hypothetical protein
MTYPNLSKIIETLGEWEKDVRKNPLLVSTLQKRIEPRISLDSCAFNFINTLQECQQYVQRPTIDFSNVRVLENQDSIYSIAVIHEKIKYSGIEKFMPAIEFIVVNPHHLLKGIGKEMVDYLVAELGSEIVAHVYPESSVFFCKVRL